MGETMDKQPRILFFDIETTPLQAWVWQCGKQYIGHKSLVKESDMWNIICITYCWNDGKPAKCIDWGYDAQDSEKVVREFDEIIKQADLIIGKNCDRFDVKMINSVRMLNGLPGLPHWTQLTDDLERQMRKYFRLPSQSLDYISNKLGLGGKIKMCMQDWIDIVTKNEQGEKSLKKMIKYGKKDVEDTRKLWYVLGQHFDSKFNMAKYQDKRIACKHCGSDNVRRNGFYTTKGKTTYLNFYCTDCSRYAGKSPVDNKGEPGQIG